MEREHKPLRCGKDKKNLIPEAFRTTVNKVKPKNYSTEWTELIFEIEVIFPEVSTQMEQVL